jgi:hypothetical protein
MNKRTTTTMSTILAAIALTAFVGPAYGGGNGKGNGADPQASSSGPGNSENAPGQLKKAEQAQQALPSPAGDAGGEPSAAPAAVPPSTQPEAVTTTSEPAAPPVTSEGHGKSKASPSAGASASSSSRKNGPAKPKTGGHGNSTHAAAVPAQSDPTTTTTTASVGVKPSNSTSHNVSAPAGSNSTKLYGNGQSAGQIAIKHGASPSTMLYGPGNSQPHKVAPCGHKARGNGGGFDVHALKSHGGKGGCLSANPPATEKPVAPRPSPPTPETATPAAPAPSLAVVSAAAAPPAIAREEHRPAVDKPKAAGSSTTKTIRKDRVHATAPFLPPRVPFPTRNDRGDTSTRFALTAAPKGTLPFTGIQLWAFATVGLGLIGAGWALRRHAHAAV